MINYVGNSEASRGAIINDLPKQKNRFARGLRPESMP